VRLEYRVTFFTLAADPTPKGNLKNKNDENYPSMGNDYLNRGPPVFKSNFFIQNRFEMFPKVSTILMNV